ncbi:hypothetical protein PRUPE_7G041100 [Prunus persica]|uniref:Uncharacterized protein n=1 Tax=Prunus persica TaxID=3760 RepID=M5VRT2_PRUPE|nr:hypothetical protein PRUPE_7G041100 [Prunus persica]
MRSPSLYDRNRASAPESSRVSVLVEEVARRVEASAEDIDHPTDLGSQKYHRMAARKIMGIIFFLSSKENKLHVCICIFLVSYLIRGW